ncbi:hypothetical protein R3P38DRAFT_2925792 [Favolaschia claudopus]|uniref:F-box domain-containing protein n=1 Tax=Favolaschia claudopus TaxID=2862362 RepID=A0AAW0C1I5_9AGAR
MQPDSSDIPGLSQLRHDELLNSNEAPEDNESSSIRTAFLKTTAALASLNDEISRLRERLEQLEVEYRSLSDEQAQNRNFQSQSPPDSKPGGSLSDPQNSPILREKLRELETDYHTLSQYQEQNLTLLSPLRRLPPEILAEIFTWTMPSARTSSLRRGFSARESPWLLTHVSSHWRAVAISTPILWSLITIFFYSAKRSLNSLYPIPMIEAQVARAQRLNIHFFGADDCPSAPQLELFQFLAKHSSLWEEVSLQLTPALFPLLDDLRGRIPLLRKVFIQWDRGGHGQKGAPSIAFLESAPSLVDVGIYNEYGSIAVALPAHQLTRYQLDAPWETHRGILARAPNVTEARISVQYETDGWTSCSDDIIELPALVHLYVTTPRVCDYIRAPALYDLVLSFKDGDETSVVTTLQSLTARSSCAIKYLGFSSFVAARAVAILHTFPSIIELRLVVAGYNYLQVRTLLENLTVSDTEGGGSGVVAPQLRAISLGSPMRLASTSYLDYDLFLKMVRSRRKSEDCALATSAVILHSGSGPHVKALSEIEALRREGMDFPVMIGEEALDILDYWLCHSRY